MEDRIVKVSPRLKRNDKSFGVLLPNCEEPLDWSGQPYDYPKMVRIGTIADGSCYFHALARSRHIPYIEKKINEKSFILGLRKDLSNKLPDKYLTLSRGSLPDLAKDNQRYSLPNLQREILESSSIDNFFNEFISDELDCDIYILHAEKKDVYIVGDDDDILFKQRPSIVILYLEGVSHYELVGVKDGDEVVTYFKPESPFILSIRDRIKELREK
jgi:hypothetical protein